VLHTRDVGGLQASLVVVGRGKLRMGGEQGVGVEQTELYLQQKRCRFTFIRCVPPAALKSIT
jgi:hypothetical protein